MTARQTLSRVACHLLWARVWLWMATVWLPIAWPV